MRCGGCCGGSGCQAGEPLCPEPKHSWTKPLLWCLQMPDVFSIGLGGGSLVRFPAAAGAAGAAASCTVGPDSVGAQLEVQALCQGGTTCTTSDVAVLLGRMELGSRAAVATGGLSKQQAAAAWAVMQGKLEQCLEQAKTRAGAHTCGVGGGAICCGWMRAGCIDAASQHPQKHHICHTQ